MGKFAVVGTKTAVVITPGLGPLSVGCPATLKRGKLLFFNVSSPDTPIDQAITIQLQRYNTTVGTSTPITAAAAANLDPGDLTAFTSDARNEITATPTLVANSILYSRTLNQKYGCEYYAPSDDASIWFPAITPQGIFWDTPILNAATGSKLKVLAHIDEK